MACHSIIDFTALPVVTVNSQSLSSTYQLLLEAIDNADYISLDLELSGLGPRKRLSTALIDDRYSNLCATASSYAILSLGVACFRWSFDDGDSLSDLPLHCQVFDVLLFSENSYMIEPTSVKFLIRHGFDFNSQYQHGLRYMPGKVAEPSDHMSASGIFYRLLKARKPVVLHNGFIDLVFLYYSFYGPLPESLDMFVADVSEMFPSGLYDTKSIAEYKFREPASYLEYLFHKCVHLNSLGPSSHYIKSLSSSFETLAQECVTYIQVVQLANNLSPVKVCQCYAYHGYCSSMEMCTKSHNIHNVFASEKLLSIDPPKRKRARRRRNRKESSQDITHLVAEELALAKERLKEEQTEDDRNDSTAYTDMPIVPELPAEHLSGADELKRVGHRSGTDAFTTGFCFTSFALRSVPVGLPLTKDSLIRSLDDYCNKIALGGKPMPLLIARSHFSSTSLNHKHNKDKLQLWSGGCDNFS